VSFLVAGVTDGSLAPRPEQAFLWLALGMMYGQRAKGPAILNVYSKGGAANERQR
jgi:hypothetical protein